MIKKCSTCKKNKEGSEYYTRKDSTDGFKGQCKECYDNKRNGILSDIDSEESNENKKRCSNCIIYKDYSEFNKRKGSIDGYRNQCRECYNEMRARRSS